ncbi:MAG: hypothetical protein KGJ02_02350 [Verrucomicrobiota bacterium]|nr:hypothetical protein [Verrucomicrobiota bacterium]
MSDEELLIWNQKGLIPGPGESEEAFRQRIEGVEGDGLPREHWELAREQLKELFDFEPGCLKAFYSNEKLTPWQGAACWIEGGHSVLQLREGFRKGRYLGIYRREEVLAHEAVHAARAAFQETENEEFFAFATARERWRRVLGPIVRRPWEVWLLGVWGLGGIWDGFTWIGAGVVSLGFCRLIRQHWRLRRAAETLLKRVGEPKRARAILFRMTDEEVRKLARGEWVEGDETLRWRLIRKAYMMNGFKESLWQKK